MSEIFDYCHIAELTDRGCKRASNEDWLAHFESPNGLVAVICDGMGGHVGGQIASHIAVEAIQQFLMQKQNGSPNELIIEAVNMANDAILKKTQIQPELTGMGATCVILIVRNGKVYIGSIGDSRIYLIRNHNIKQLTVDQSYVQMLLDAGSITPEQAEHHPRKNEITNALGLPGMQPATVLPDAIVPEAGDCFLLCSDGLSGMVSDKDICKIVSRQSDMTQRERVEELVSRAKRNGGLDNISCQIVEFSITPNSTEKKKWWRKGLPIISILAILIAGISIFLYFYNNQKENIAHNLEIKDKMMTMDSIIILKKIQSGKGDIVMELTEDKDFQGIKLLQRCPQKDTTLTVLRPLSLKKIEFSPSNLQSKLSIKYLNQDSTHCIISFKEKVIDEKEIAIIVHGEKDSYMFIVPIIVKTDSRKPTGLDITKKSGFVEETEFDYENKIDTTMQNQRTDCSVEVEIKKNLENQKITLWSKQGINTATDLYFNYGFHVVGGSMSEQDKGWYTVTNNGAQCILKIKNTKENPIPKSEDAIIYIPTTANPDCNDGKGIIIRINKSNS